MPANDGKETASVSSLSAQAEVLPIRPIPAQTTTSISPHWAPQIPTEIQTFPIKTTATTPTAEYINSYGNPIFKSCQDGSAEKNKFPANTLHNDQTW